MQGFSSRSSDLGEFNAGLDKLLETNGGEGDSTADSSNVATVATMSHLVADIGNAAAEPTAPVQLALSV